MKYAKTRFCENTDEIIFSGVGPYDIPEIKPERYEPCDFLGFNYALTTTSREEKGVHFFLDDYQFERVWREWKKYSFILQQFKAVLAPDFSTYTDYPRALQIWNHYRKHFVAAYLQTIGAKVYPTISWSDKSSYAWCFDGEPVGATVAVSSIGTQKGKESKTRFLDGYMEMLARLKPETVIFYGAVPAECPGNIVNIVPYQQRLRRA